MVWGVGQCWTQEGRQRRVVSVFYQTARSLVQAGWGVWVQAGSSACPEVSRGLWVMAPETKKA